MNYEYTVDESEASVAAGTIPNAGSPDVSGSVTILSMFTVNGKEYHVTSIGERAFYNCSGLTSVTIPNSVTSIGLAAFYNCSGLTSVEIPNSVTSLGDYVFYGCSGLTSIMIPNGVTSIGEAAFYNCSGLISVEIPNGVTSIGESAFDGCSCLTSVEIPNSVTIIGDYAFWGCSGLTSIMIPKSVTSIGRSAFSRCSGLTSAEIPNSVTSIGDYAFYNCSGLTSVTIPNSVTTIGKYAFYACSDLISVHISDITAWCKIAFSNLNSNPLHYAHHLYLGDDEIAYLVIPNSVTSIGNFAFEYCKGLTSVTIPGSVTSIGEYAFSYCSGLTSLTIGNSVTSIGSRAFYECSGLTSVLIPNSVTSIGSQVFYSCSSLTTITIGSGVKTIDSQAFAKCPELTDVYCYAETVPKMRDSNNKTCTDAFADSYINYATLHVPTASIDDYKAVEPWASFKTIVGLDGILPDNPEPEVKKCATPTIAFVDGKLKFSCETESVEYVSEVTVGDAKKNYSSEVSLTGIYKVSVYATKAGYDNSDVATLEFALGAGGEVCDVNKDGTIDVADIATIIRRMAGKE